MSSAWTHTSLGKALVLSDPRPEDVDLHEICRALGRICRYAGNIDGSFYSVAEHSFLISEFLEDEGHAREVQLAGLLHDAHEAYLGDITYPVQLLLFEKSPEAKEAYRQAKTRLSQIVADKVQISAELLESDLVKICDLRILLDERETFLGKPFPKTWDLDETGLRPLGVHFRGWGPEEAGRKMWTKLMSLTGDVP